MATSTIKQVTNNSGNSYCKMPDGTLIQWGSGTINTDGTNTAVGAAGAVYASKTLYIDLPMSFISNDYVIFGYSRYHTGHILPLGVTAAGADKMQMIAYDLYQRPLNDGLYKFYWIAVGRWK